MPPPTELPAPAVVIEPSAEQLRLAYRALQQPNHWPPTLESALAHPVYGVCLRAKAREMSRARPVSAPLQLASLPRDVPPVPPTPVHPPSTRRNGTPLTQPAPVSQRPAAAPRQRSLLDRKRAAANDFDDE